jgi:hypothetical protein
VIFAAKWKKPVFAHITQVMEEKITFQLGIKIIQVGG